MGVYHGRIFYGTGAFRELQKGVVMKVLIVDDTKSSRKLMLRALKRQKFEVVEAANGAEAIELLRDKSFDGLVTDYDMPNMNGLDLLWRMDTEKIRIPTLLYTATMGKELYLPSWADYLYKGDPSVTLDRIGIHLEIMIKDKDKNGEWK